jgi:hypothetical protein
MWRERCGEAMKLGIATFTCGTCGKVFEAPEFGPAYGYFLLRSSNNFMAFLDAINDQAFEEVDSLIKTNRHTRRLSEDDRSDVLHSIYGELACDPDPKGAAFVIGMQPTCPTCGAQEIAAWDFKEPPESVDIEVPPVTHKRWNSLTLEEKKAETKRLIATVK